MFVNTRFSPNGQYVAAGLASGTVTLFNTQTGDTVRVFPNTVPYTKFCFTPDGKTLVCGGIDSVIYFWDTESGTLTKTFVAYPALPSSVSPSKPSYGIYDIDISPDGNFLLVAITKIVDPNVIDSIKNVGLKN